MNEVDKDELYGRYQRNEDWQNRLYRKTVHKAVDIPDAEDMHVDNRKYGVGVKEIVAAGLMASLVGVAFNGLPIRSPESPAEPPPVAQPAPPPQIETDVVLDLGKIEGYLQGRD